jgi:hypothetical protein
MIVMILELEKEFLISPLSTSVSIGERVRLRCEPPYGSPLPIVYWTKDGKNVSIPLDHHDLVIPSTRSTDFGAYRCIAINGLVRQSAIAHLTEFHRPKIHIRPSAIRIDIQRGESVDFNVKSKVSMTMNNIKLNGIMEVKMDASLAETIVWIFPRHNSIIVEFTCVSLVLTVLDGDISFPNKFFSLFMNVPY